MRLFGILAVVAVMCVHGADGLPAWPGEALRTGWSHHQCTPSYGPDGLTVDSRGRDPFIVTPQFNLEKPSNLHEVVFRAKTTVGGLGELFYSRPGDRAAPQALAQPFQWIGDGEWHEYRIRPFWGGQPKVVSIRIDMPADPAVKTTFSSVAVVSSNEKMEPVGTAVPGVGAAFTVPPQDRTVWANIEWIADKGEYVKVREHLHLIGDGKERRYFFDAKSCVGWNANYPYPNQRGKWRGDILLFRVINAKTGAEVPIKDLEFCTKRPALPAELRSSPTRRFPWNSTVRDVAWTSRWACSTSAPWPLNYTPADIGRGPYPVVDEDGGPVKPYGGLQWR